MFQNDDNESMTETINYIIKQFSDTYLLPAISATLIALIYFAYKWGRTNLGYKPLTIINMLYVGDDTKRESDNSDILTDPNIAVNVLQPMTVSVASLTQLRNKSLSNKMLPVKNNSIFDNEMEKLHYNSLSRNQNICAYPIYEVWCEDSSNLMEPVWDYDDMSYPSRDLSVSKTNLFYKIKKGDFYYKHSNNYSADAQKMFNTDVRVYDINEKSVKNKNTPGTFSRDKQERAQIKEYYRLCYDSEDSNDDLYDYPEEIFGHQVNSSNPVLETSRSEDSKPFNKTIFDESEFVSVDLNSCNHSKGFSKHIAIGVEKDILKGEPFEDYWKIV